MNLDKHLSLSNLDIFLWKAQQIKINAAEKCFLGMLREENKWIDFKIMS